MVNSAFGNSEVKSFTIDEDKSVAFRNKEDMDRFGHFIRELDREDKRGKDKVYADTADSVTLRFRHRGSYYGPDCPKSLFWEEQEHLVGNSRLLRRLYQV